jgi:flavin-dependent dehydrogenase
MPVKQCQLFLPQHIKIIIIYFIKYQLPKSYFLKKLKKLKIKNEKRATGEGGRVLRDAGPIHPVD